MVVFIPYKSVCRKGRGVLPKDTDLIQKIPFLFMQNRGRGGKRREKMMQKLYNGRGHKMSNVPTSQNQ